MRKDPVPGRNCCAGTAQTETAMQRLHKQRLHKLLLRDTSVLHRTSFRAGLKRDATTNAAPGTAFETE